ncbi:MAG: hypothetical protein PHZ00_04895 [Candidatus Peribacteraceae bacterium]|nr:hypothetical protein [Candidatus Peribacteraceae bacterium]
MPTIHVKTEAAEFWQAMPEDAQLGDESLFPLEGGQDSQALVEALNVPIQTSLCISRYDATVVLFTLQRLFGERFDHIVSYTPPSSSEQDKAGSIVVTADGINELIRQQIARVSGGHTLEIPLRYVSIEEELDVELRSYCESVQINKLSDESRATDEVAKSWLLNNICYLLPGNSMRERMVQDRQRKLQGNKLTTEIIDEALRQAGIEEGLIQLTDQEKGDLGDNTSLAYAENVTKLYEAYAILRRQGFGYWDICG